MAAFSMGEDARQDGDDAVDDAAQIDAQRPVPVAIAGQLDRPDHADAGIVDEQMDLAEPRLGLIGGGRVSVAVGDVELQRQHRADAKLGRGLVEMILPDVGDHDVHAGLLQRLGDAEADAGGAAGDERGLTR